MTYFTTASYGSINYSQLTTLLSTEDFHHHHNNVTLNLTTVLLPEQPPESVYSFTEKIIIGIIAVIAVLCTVIGNFMVMISFKIDKQLQTISNYFLFSLAIADLAIGLVSMPLFAIQTIAGYWPFGSFVCDTWLALDYLASNASVLNLLIISFDRYFSVTRPLTYRAKRTNKKAAFMIALAWLVSLILWPPWIYSWPYIEGNRTVPEFECYIQFIETNQLITFITAISAFYVPVTIMCGLYFRIWRETKKRQKDLPNLTAGGGMSSGGGASHHQSIKKDASKRSNSSDETSTVNHQIGEYIDPNFWHPHAAGDNESNSYYSGAHPHSIHDLSRRTSTKQNIKSDSMVESIKNWCVAWWHSGQEEETFEDFGDWCDYEGEQSFATEYGTPSSVDTPVASSVSRCTSLNIIRGDQYARGNFDSPSTFVKNRQQQTLVATQSSNISGNNNNNNKSNPDKLPSSSSSNLKRSLSQDSVYTILIRLPLENHPNENARESDRVDVKPSIKMYPEDVPSNLSRIVMSKSSGGGSDIDSFSGGTLRKGEKDPFALNMPPHSSYEFNNRLPMNAKIIPRKPPLTAREKQQQKAALHKKKKAQDKRQESKAAKTLSAILLSFIVTWLPYNILVLIKPITSYAKSIPKQLWDLFYALCYINSTINPVLYALCNASFRRTYIRILTCKWQSSRREGVSRGVYN